MAFEQISHALDERKQQHLLRQRFVLKRVKGKYIECDGKTYLNFSSNDYLGLADSTELTTAWAEGALLYGVGSGASPLVTGHHYAHQALEQQLCEWLDVEAALLFNSGFSANQALIKALLHKGDLLIQDKLNHASLIEAGMLSAVTMKRYLHNDLDSLAAKLALPVAGSRLVITEGIFSMDGDAAPLTQMDPLCQQHDAWLMVDDAHGIGVLGEKGTGSPGAELAQVRMATFGKALGVGGAFIAGSNELINYLVNFSRSYIYSTAMPPAMAHTIAASVNLVSTNGARRDNLNELIAYFKQLIAKLPVTLLPSDSAIQPVIFGSSAVTLQVSDALAKAGFWVAAIRPPTVPANSARLRITLTAQHTKQDILALVCCIEKTLLELRIDTIGLSNDE